MANTFSQIYIQTVFAVSNRLSLIKPEFKEDLHKYITGIVKNQKQKLIAINGMSDHLHILIGLKPSMALADLVREMAWHKNSAKPNKSEPEADRGPQAGSPLGVVDATGSPLTYEGDGRQ